MIRDTRIRIVELFEKVNNLSINSRLVSEGLKEAKKFLDLGQISKSDFDVLLSMDKTPTKKYIYWMVKVAISNDKDMWTVDELGRYIDLYDDLINKNKIANKDINQYKNFKEFKNDVDSALPESKSKKDLSSDYEVLIDNEDLYVVVPYTHEAARKVGLRDFNFRPIPNTVPQEYDCAWCITFKTPEHWNNYFYKDEITFYLIKVKSERLKNQIKDELGIYDRRIEAIAVGVYKGGSKFAFDAMDTSLREEDIDKYLKIIGLE